MIVKTGANYQDEGGYIEFARGASKAIVDGEPVPSIVYSDSIGVVGLQKFLITRIAGISGTVRYTNYAVYVATSGEKFYDYQSNILNEGATNNITLPAGFGSVINAPAGYHPKLGDGSKNVKLVKSGASYYIYTTGADPIAVIELEADA